MNVLITGSEGGIGKALCQAFINKDYTVIGCDLEQRSSKCDKFIQVDLAKLNNPSHRSKIVKSIKSLVGGSGLKVLINNAAIQILAKTEDITEEHWNKTLSTNVLAAFYLTQSLLPELESVGGSVINITSIHAKHTKPSFVCYATSKAALSGLTRAMAIDLAPRVRVNAISPAATSTDMLEAGFEGNAQARVQLSNFHPMQRLAIPEEIAEIALFLISPGAEFITGQTISVDGGISVRLHDPE